MGYVVRCRYIGTKGQPAGVGYLDKASRCTTSLGDAKKFNNEADAWTFAAVSGELVPWDAWVEPEETS